MSPAALAKPTETVPDHPPAPSAAAVLGQRAAKERELAALEAKVGEVAYRAATTGKAGAASLAELHGEILAARFEVECNSAAHAYAVEADRTAVAAWWREVHAMPAEEAIAGITKTECCGRCSEAGCVISGQECVHPQKLGANLAHRHQGNSAIRRLHRAAAQKLGVLR